MTKTQRLKLETFFLQALEEMHQCCYEVLVYVGVANKPAFLTDAKVVSKRNGLVFIESKCLVSGMPQLADAARERDFIDCYYRVQNTHTQPKNVRCRIEGLQVDAPLFEPTACFIQGFKVKNSGLKTN